MRKTNGWFSIQIDRIKCSNQSVEITVIYVDIVIRLEDQFFKLSEDCPDMKYRLPNIRIFYSENKREFMYLGRRY